MIITPQQLFCITKMNTGKISDEEAERIYNEQMPYPEGRKEWEEKTEIINEYLNK